MDKLCEGSSSTNQESENDELSAGGIAGIVTDSVAFAAIVRAGSFFLHKKFLLENLKAKKPNMTSLLR